MFLFVFRALLGIGMGAEWPAAAALAMEAMAGALGKEWYRQNCLMLLICY